MKKQKIIFSLIDAEVLLVKVKNPRDYWYCLKKGEMKNAVDLSTVKIKAKDGKLRKNYVATKKQLW